MSCNLLSLVQLEDKQIHKYLARKTSVKYQVPGALCCQMPALPRLRFVQFKAFTTEYTSSFKV